MHSTDILQTPGMSVVICCFNSAQRIIPTLQHLASQRTGAWLRWELIVVDNNSDDETVAVSQRIWKQLGHPAPLTIVTERQPGQSHARISGFRAASHDLLAFVDDDNWLQADWLRVAHDSLRDNPLLGAVGGSIVPEFEEIPPPWIELYTPLLACRDVPGNSLKLLPRGSLIAGAGCAMRTAAFREFLQHYGGFTLGGRSGSITTSGDDIELMYALSLLGWRVGIHGALTLTHYIPRQRCEVSYLKRLSRSVGVADNLLDPLRRVASECVPPSRVRMLELFYLVKVAFVISQLFRLCSHVRNEECGSLVFQIEFAKRLEQLSYLIRSPLRYLAEARRARRLYNALSQFRAAASDPCET
ncbi:MAG: glycosyltransferase family 2 protein [Verrucomicrobiaceae bacterium]|nr:MAG: glycosyltransferase family 2 protein [Verrucomicrobiaceae bacterium]